MRRNNFFVSLIEIGKTNFRVIYRQKKKKKKKKKNTSRAYTNAPVFCHVAKKNSYSSSGILTKFLFRVAF
jgi:hypothetical protein